MISITPLEKLNTDFFVSFSRKNFFREIDFTNFFSISDSKVFSRAKNFWKKCTFRERNTNQRESPTQKKGWTMRILIPIPLWLMSLQIVPWLNYNFIKYRTFGSILTLCAHELSCCLYLWKWLMNVIQTCYEYVNG